MIQTRDLVAHKHSQTPPTVSQRKQNPPCNTYDWVLKCHVTRRHREEDTVETMGEAAANIAAHSDDDEVVVTTLVSKWDVI